MLLNVTGSALREDGESAEDKEVLAAPPSVVLNQYSEQAIESLVGLFSFYLLKILILQVA